MHVLWSEYQKIVLSIFSCIIIRLSPCNNNNKKKRHKFAFTAYFHPSSSIHTNSALAHTHAPSAQRWQYTKHSASFRTPILISVSWYYHATTISQLMPSTFLFLLLQTVTNEISPMINLTRLRCSFQWKFIFSTTFHVGRLDGRTVAPTVE